MTEIYDFDFNNAKRQDDDLPDYSPVPPEQAFQNTIAAAGLGCPFIKSTGQIERYDAPGEKRGRKSNWYVFFPDDIPGGSAGSWKDGGLSTLTWSARDVSEMSQWERQRYENRMAEARRLREQAEQVRRAEAREKATKRWEAAKNPAPGHAYLAKKQVRAYGIRQDEEGRLVIPIRDAEGRLHSLEYIDPHGGKRFLTGGELKGHFHVIPGEGHTAYLVEGYATGASIHEATGAEVLIAFSAGNLQHAAKAYSTSKRLVVAADNDVSEVGLKGAQATGLPYVTPEEAGKDFNDIAVEKGLAEVKRQLVPPENKFARRVLASPAALNEAFLETLSMSWTIKKIIPESTGLMMIYGAPSSGKSFAALDMALSIAHGLPWHGYNTKKKSVLYLAAEGQAGVLKRIEAWRQYHGMERIDNFSLLPIPCLIDNPGQLGELLAMIRSLPAMPGVIILDTVARSMLGDENSTLDMGKLVNACGELHEATKATICLIHHTGKDETRGARGAIALTGATDTMFKVVRTTEPKQYILHCERQKDDEPFESMLFHFDVVDTGHVNADGDAVTSLVPVYDPDAKITKKEDKGNGKKPRGAAKIALDAFMAAIKEFGECPPESIKMQMGGLVLPTDQVLAESSWRLWAYRKGISDGNDEAKRQAFFRARNSLVAQGVIDTIDGYYWLCDKA